MFIEPVVPLLLDKDLRDAARKNYLQEQRHKLNEAAKPLRATGLHVTCQAVFTDDMLEEIRQYAAELQPDLLIKDVRHEPLLKRVFTTPLDWHLLRECPVPVHLVSGDNVQALPRRVIAAVDPSRPETQISGLNERIIQEAISLALQCDAELHLLYAFDPAPVYVADAGGSGLAWADLAKDLRHSLEKLFATLAENYGVPPERRQFVTGPARTAISECASRLQADVLVMGTVHRQDASRLLGSTTEHLLHRAPCSILAVKP
ncbi:hypothetical protein D3C77_489710 [compost metagenome]